MTYLGPKIRCPAGCENGIVVCKPPCNDAHASARNPNGSRMAQHVCLSCHGHGTVPLRDLTGPSDEDLEVARLEARLSAAVFALRRYGWHFGACPRLGMRLTLPCTCGLDAAVRSFDDVAGGGV